MNTSPLILASSSQTRKDLMDRLHIDYTCIVPNIDETPRGENHADHLAKRLAFEKARAISEQHPDAIVIGSDQVAWREGAPDIFIGKPLTIEKAIKQLQANSDKIFSVHDKFHRTLILSGFCLLKIAKISLNSSFFPKPIKR